MVISGERPIPFPGVPPRRETEEESPAKREMSRRHFLGWLAGGGLLLGGAGLGLEHIFNPQTSFLQRLFNFLANIREVTVPPYFDNNADKGVIGDNNIQYISQEEAKRSDFQPIDNDTSLIFLFPFQLPKGAKVTYEKILSEVSIPQDARIEATQKGIKDNTIFVLSAESTVIAPIDTNVLVVRGREDWGENPNLSPDARLFYYDKAKDRTYVLWFFALDDASGHNAFNPLVPTQTYEPSIWRDTNWERLPKIQQGTPVLKTTRENQLVQLNIRAYKGKVVGPQAEIIDKTFFAVTPQFLTTATPEGQKLFVLAK